MAQQTATETSLSNKIPRSTCLKTILLATPLGIILFNFRYKNPKKHAFCNNQKYL